MSNSFQKTLDHIRSIADSEAHKGRLFERLMKTYFVEDPLVEVVDFILNSADQFINKLFAAGVGERARCATWKSRRKNA